VQREARDPEGKWLVEFLESRAQTEWGKHGVDKAFAWHIVDAVAFDPTRGIGKIARACFPGVALSARSRAWLQTFAEGPELKLMASHCLDELTCA
jgi:hypothetical protein